MSLQIKNEALGVVRLAYSKRLLLKLSRDTKISYHILIHAAKGADVLDADHCQTILEYVTGLKLELR